MMRMDRRVEAGRAYVGYVGYVVEEEGAGEDFEEGGVGVECEGGVAEKGGGGASWPEEEAD